MREKESGFTLVELMIVLVVLGILAMTVIPEYSSASSDSKESALATNLQSLTRQIELYRLEHGGKLPNIDHADRADASPTRFVSRLTSKTDQFGRIITSGECGPYLLEWPENPFADPATATDILFGTGASPRNGKTGWYFNTKTGEISPNSALGMLSSNQAVAK